jgi:hypothetical protein
MHVRFYFTIAMADESHERLMDAPMFSGSIIDKLSIEYGSKCRKNAWSSFMLRSKRGQVDVLLF